MPIFLKPRKRSSEIDFDRVNELAGELSLSPLLVQILYNRGYDTVEACREFLYPDENSMLNPFDILNMDKLVEKINAAEKITVYGDYDADGVNATAIMVTALKKIGKTVSYYIPHRVNEGYGLHENALDKIFENGCDLLITVDCGISSVELIKKQLEKGRDIVVTDHHTIGEALPPCVVLNPHRVDDSYRNPDLCGAGIAFKVAQALLGKDADELVDYAGVATIADIVPLLGENRYIVKKALERLNSNPRPCFKALIDAAGIKEEITALKVGFNIAPRINAVGRVDDAGKMLEFLLSEDGLTEKTEEINALNASRKKINDDIFAEANEKIESERLMQKHKILILASENWHVGVLGISAARIAERYKRPCILFSVKDGIANGSARSVDGIDLYALLSGASDILEHFGGHKMAAGLGCKVERLEKLNERLDGIIADTCDLKLFYPSARYDAKANLSDITADFIKSLELLEPCGCENEEVRIRINDCRADSIRTMGGDNSHLRMTLEDSTGALTAVAFNYREHDCDYFNLNRASVIVAPSINEWNNRTEIQLQLKSAKECENIQPRKNAERLTAAYYSHLAYKKTDKAQVTFISDREELEYTVSSWSDEDVAGTLILCDLPEYAADCIRLLENEAPRFDISYYKPINSVCGYNSLVVGAEDMDFTPFKRVLIYDFLNAGYADYIAQKAPWVEIYAFKCGLEVFDSVFDEYKRFDRNDMATVYKTVLSFDDKAISRSDLTAQLASRCALPQPVVSVALDTFAELGFFTLNDDYSVSINKNAPKRRLEESRFYNSMLKCVKK